MNLLDHICDQKNLNDIQNGREFTLIPEKIRALIGINCDCVCTCLPPSYQIWSATGMLTITRAVKE